MLPISEVGIRSWVNVSDLSYTPLHQTYGNIIWSDYTPTTKTTTVTTSAVETYDPNITNDSSII